MQKTSLLIAYYVPIFYYIFSLCLSLSDRRNYAIIILACLIYFTKHGIKVHSFSYTWLSYPSSLWSSSSNINFIWPSHSSPYIFPKELKISRHSDSCIAMIKAAQFTVAKSWKKLTCPPTDEWKKKSVWFFCVSCSHCLLCFVNGIDSLGLELGRKLRLLSKIGCNVDRSQFS